MSTVPNDVDSIRRQMAQIRRELHEDVQDVVATAEAATDWRRYITAYPWAMLGAAFVVGYLVVPRRERPPITSNDVSKLADLATSQVREAAQTAERKIVDPVVSRVEAMPPEKRRKTMIGAAFGLMAPILWKYAQGYALKYAEQWLLSQQAAHAGPRPDEPARPQAPTGPATYPYPGFGPGGPRPGPSGPRQEPGKFGV